MTEQRRIICSYLANNRTHPTPSRVYEDLSRQHPDISRATVYNTLNALQELGAIVEISFGDGHTHYETNTTPHVNLVCLRCHTIVDLPVTPKIDADEDLLWSRIGFQPAAVKMDVFGFCDSCRRRKKAEILDQFRAARNAAPTASRHESGGIS